MHNNDKYLCRVCGLIQKDAPWGDDGLSPTYQICDCCGVEFGYEDSTLEGVKRFRKNWIASGATWFNSKMQPVRWDFEEQLKNVPQKYQD